jgi:hypothetical protein
VDVDSQSHPLYELLEQLDEAHIYYSLSRHRPDSVLVSIVVVGERIEVDVCDDGHMEVSRFLGDEGIEGGRELLERLLRKYKD